MSLSKPSERYRVNPSLALSTGGARACVATTDRTIRQSFFTGVTSSETRCSEKCEKSYDNMGNQSKFRVFVTFQSATSPEKTFFPAQNAPKKKTYTDFLSPVTELNTSEVICDEDCLCYQEKYVFLSHIIGSCEIITIEED